MRNFKNTLRGIILLSIRNWNKRLFYLQLNKIHHPYYPDLENTANCFSISAYLQDTDPDNKDSYTPKKISSALSSRASNLKGFSPITGFLTSLKGLPVLPPVISIYFSPIIPKVVI